MLIVAVFACVLIISAITSARQVWFLYGLLMLILALRFGVAVTVLGISWTITLAVLLPVIMLDRFTHATSEVAEVLEVNCAVYLLCVASILVARTISDSMREIENRKLAEEALKQSETKFRTLVENITAIVYIAAPDATRTTLYVSPQVESILGFTQDDYQADPGLWARELHPDDRQQVLDELERCIETGRSFTTEYRIFGRDGQYRWFRDDATMVRDERNRPRVLQGVMFDISQRKRAIEAMAQLNAELDQRNSQLASVIHATSQDLRSPLIRIQGFARELVRAAEEVRNELIHKDVGQDISDRLTPILEQEITQAGPFIEEAVKRVDVMLDGLARLQKASDEPLEMTILDVNALVEKVVSPLRYEANKKSVAIEVDDLPACKGDAVRIGQLFGILLRNAMDYLDGERAGRIYVSGRVEPAHVIYCVGDNGVGMAEEQRMRCFDLFYSRDGMAASAGEGLGLTIARRIVDRHGGRIWVESEIGHGSRFYVSLPSADRDATPAGQAPAATQPA